MADKSISFDILDDDYHLVVNDFCSWEILDPYHDSDSDDFSFPDAADDVTTSEIQVISQYQRSPSDDDDDEVVDFSVIGLHKVVTEDLGGGLNAFVSFPLPVDDDVDVDVVMPESDQKIVGIGAVVYDESEGKYGIGAVYGYGDEDEDDNIDDYEPGNKDLYDDELIPIGLSNKLEKQRIRKSGKKGGSGKKKNSKKMPHHSNRPGCVFGKHGLGVQHLMI